MAESEETKPSTEEKMEVEKEQITPTEQIKEEAVPEEKLVEEKPKHVPLGKSRVIEGATKEEFMEFARKFYPHLVEDFEGKRISFGELKTKIERDAGLVWIALKE